MKNSKITYLLLALFLSTAAFAQEREINTHPPLEVLDASDLDTIIKNKSLQIATASRSLRSVSDLPFTSYIISKKEIKENNYNTLVDVLKDIPGFRVSQPGDSKTGETFTINGLLGNYYTKILLNGVPISPSAAPGMPLGAQLPIKQAERIEVITNPSSAIYGSDAMGGVINIITTQYNKKVLHSDVTLSIGNNGYHEVNLLMGGKIGIDEDVIKYNLYANYSGFNDMNTKALYPEIYNSNNYLHIDTTGITNNPLYKGTSSEPYLGNMPDNNFMYGIDLEYKSLKFSIFSFSRLAHSAIGNIPFFTAYYLPDTYWGENNRTFTLSYDTGNSKYHSNTTLSYVVYRMKNGSSELVVNSVLDKEPGMYYSYGASDDIVLDQLFNFNVTKKSNLAIGASFAVSGNLPIYSSLDSPFELGTYKPFSKSLTKNNSGYYILSEDELNLKKSLYGEDYEDLSPFNFYKAGAFGQYDYTGDKLNVFLDLRVDYNSIYGFTASPRVSTLYKISDDLSVKAAYSTAFKSPSSYYKYNSFFRPPFDKELIPFPNNKLTNEKLRAIELNLIYEPSKNYYFELQSSIQKRQNEILFSLVNPNIIIPSQGNNVYYGYVNNTDNSSTIFMAQALLRFEDVVKSIKLDVDFSLTYQERNETTNKDILRFDTYSAQPKLYGTVRVGLNISKNLRLIASAYANNNYDNNYTTFFQHLFPETDIKDYLLSENLASITSNMNLNYKSNNFTFYMRIKNVFNSKSSGIQTADPLKGLYYNPQNGRMAEFGINFEM